MDLASHSLKDIIN
jgi:serine/threonine protein kinase